MEAIVESVQIEGKKRFHSYSYLEVFFTNREGHEDAQMLRERQDAFLDRMIESRHAEGEVMQLLFSVIADFSAPRRRARIQTFLRHNRDFDSFHSLPMTPMSGGWTGSAVPEYQREVDWFESLLPLLEDIDLLRHRQLVGQTIQDVRNSIEREKKRDFMGH